ncbi:MAG: 5'-methylthioadenosine/adenosylhomocysteine nucleosidase [Bacteroides sp.]|nr:5'-methylthioadenosine/adenosylhomocysteine nucleosidase [Bacteroides sp.]MCM1413292.1 5'-methylthioadenosine/adenosylhomocysteine nucleosidase [Bacteroides sp.]MCM1471398.1 5'-methylthioadenosine/adenosylhomocysteine nucleosidase [Bacteroides sp.]
MKIGIIVAMDKELDLLLPLLEDQTISTINGFTFHSGTIGQSSIIAMKCGIGKVNAAVGTMTLIDHFSPELIINTGVAGGTGGNAGVLDIVVGTRIAYHDVWCGPGTEWGDAAGCPRFFHTSDKVNSLPCLHEGDTVKHGLVASGDVFVSDAHIIDHIRSLYPDVDAVDMESAAIAQVCYLRGVEFACMRVISDTPGADDNISQYKNFWEEAPRHTFDMLRQIINEL